VIRKPAHELDASRSAPAVAGGEHQVARIALPAAVFVAAAETAEVT
jgi:hypothetical protein